MAAVVLLSACRRHDGPNVVLITLDTTRADRLGVMGDAEARTPNLDAVAARGALFERAYASAPLTLPSHATMLTGLEPNVHGVHDNGRFVVAPSFETVAERLAGRGYATAAFVAAFVLDSVFGLDQGFALYDDEIQRSADPLSFIVPSRRAQVVTDRALAWLEAPAKGPFFVWVHYYDVHAPRRPPPPFDAMEDSYAGSLAYVDAEVGRLLAGVTRAAKGRDTLVVVVGDHGESLGEHDEMTHGLVAYDSTLHVPLIAAGPGFPPGTRSRAFARTADVAATILAAAGAPSLPGGDGRPLQQQLAARGDDATLGYFEAFAPQYTMGWARIGGVRTARWKYSGEPQPFELYDVLADPGETENRVAAEPAVAARLARHYEELKAPAAPEQAPAMLSLEVQERLAALGYWEAGQQFPAGEAPDPRRFVAVMGLVDAARGLAVQGRVAASIEALEILASSPISRPLALRSLAVLFLQVGRTADAVDAFQALAALTSGVEPRLGLAGALIADDRAADALHALDLLPATAGAESARAQLIRARALLVLDRFDEAEAAAAAVLRREPGHDAARDVAARARALRDGAPAEIERLQAFLQATANAAALIETRGLLAELLHGEGRDVEALQVLQGAASQPPEYRALEAEIAAARGNLPKAVELYEAVVRERPASQSYRLALANLYDEVGRGADALAAYDALIATNPKDATLLVDRGAIRFRAGRTADAEADYREAITRGVMAPEVLLNLALVELADGRSEAAERNLLRAVELNPRYAKAHFHLAQIYRDRGDWRSAIHAEQAVAFAGEGAAVSKPESASTRTEK